MIAWNEFLYAFVFLNSRELFTMPIKVQATFNDPSPRPHVVMAASTIMTLPVVLLFLALERFLEEGLTAGGVKGQRIGLKAGTLHDKIRPAWWL